MKPAPYVLIVFLTILFQSCSTAETYKMPNLLGGDDYVDVSYLVKQGYKPIYCDTADSVVGYLINPKPSSITNAQEAELKKGFINWLYKNRIALEPAVLNKLVLAECSKYQYTYCIIDEPLDVYKTSINLKSDTISAYFRMNAGKVILPYDEQGWVL